MSYPRPAIQANYPTTNPRTALPYLETPPVIPRSELPPLPGGPRPQSSLPEALSRTHTLSTHIITAAFPRVSANLYNEADYAPPPVESKEARKQRVKDVFEKISVTKRKYEAGASVGTPRREVLYNVFNRYARKGPLDPDGLTIIVTHAVGFPKEIWEPAYAHIIEQTEAENSGVRVNEIWGFESVHHGDSALINEGNLGDMFDWMENTRDIVNFLLYYLPPTAQASGDPGHAAELPLHLPRLPESVAEYRRQHGFDGGEGGSRQIIGLGHSAGATALFMAAVFEPKLLHSLTVLEPIVLIPEVNDNPIFASWITGAIGRRDKWASREEAHASFASSPSFSYWHPSVLETFIKYGIAEDKNGPVGSVKLKGPVFLEAQVFNERRCATETWESLAKLDPSIEVRFIYSGKGATATGGKKSSQETAWRRPVNVSNTKIPVSHLMVQESPSEVAKAVVQFLQIKYGSSHRGITSSVGAAGSVPEARL